MGIDTGLLNQRITIQKRTTATNENGFSSETWAEYYSCRSYVNGLSGSEYWAAHAVQAETTKVFTVRYCREVAAVNPKDYRIVFKDDVYNITNVDIVRYENDTVKIKAQCQIRGESV